jgi:hypothetical protein
MFCSTCACTVVIETRRIRHALILSHFDFLVDNYLGIATRSLYSRDLYTLENLPSIPGDLQFIVVSRTSNAELGNRISKKFKNAHVLYFSNLTSG